MLKLKCYGLATLNQNSPDPQIKNHAPPIITNTPPIPNVTAHASFELRPYSSSRAPAIRGDMNPGTLPTMFATDMIIDANLMYFNSYVNIKLKGHLWANVVRVALGPSNVKREKELCRDRHRQGGINVTSRGSHQKQSCSWKYGRQQHEAFSHMYFFHITTVLKR